MKRLFKRSNMWGIVVLFLVIFFVCFLIVASYIPAPVAEAPAHYNADALTIKKNPVIHNWGAADFAHYRNDDEREEAGISIIFNEMLCEIETQLRIPTAFPLAEVKDNSDQLLKRIYGSLPLVPADVYRVACIKISNVQPELKKLYRGKQRNIQKAVLETLKRYYFSGYGKPAPDREVIPSLENKNTKE